MIRRIGNAAKLIENTHSCAATHFPYDRGMARTPSKKRADKRRKEAGKYVRHRHRRPREPGSRQYTKNLARLKERIQQQQHRDTLATLHSKLADSERRRIAAEDRLQQIVSQVEHDEKSGGFLTTTL